MTEIEEALSSDIDGIASLEREIFPRPWSSASVESVVGKEHITTLVAKEAQTVLGYLVCYHIVNEGEIARVAVKEDRRRESIGRRLMDEMIRRGKQAGMVAFSLEVRESNRPAIGLYQKFSFRTEGRRKRYYEAPEEDALIMWRKE